MDRKLKNLNGSPGRARTADLVINSHPLYQLSYRGSENLEEGASYCIGGFLVNAEKRGQHPKWHLFTAVRRPFKGTDPFAPFFQGQIIGFPSQRVRVTRGRPVFDRQMTRGFA